MGLISSNEKKRRNLIKGLKWQASEMSVSFPQGSYWVGVISKPQGLSSECSTDVVVS